ncbi:TetR family transcriptional regulator [Thiomonas sp. X19]|uniref:TetR/AcrR family transcriptional regulator n=1 Tax=Thiomonas sp. X19 TaxID=1050370 RepID=UPI000B672B24|nr:TetR/AcrR family transcriptional regulator [Thiomonas sp. X19]SCC92028.1 TetR family transcriptional regulator [Thiomonas sp. X19]
MAAEPAPIAAAAPRRRAAAPAVPAAGRIRQSNEAGIVRAAEAVFARDGFRGASMAEIAAQAGVAKANIHYYFRTKRQLYRAVLEGMLHDWLAETDSIRADADPAQALGAYVRAKMTLAQTRPEASRVFAGEMLRGAPEMQDILRGELRELVARKSAVIEGWIAQGRMAPVDPPHLFFTIWAATQTYADFAPQVRAVLGARSLRGAPWQRATDHVVSLVLRGCGLTELAAETAPSRAPGGLRTPGAPHPSPPRLREGSKTSKQV